MPDPRPLVAIERQSGSVSDICLSGEASNAFSIAASRFTSSSSFASFSLSRVLVSSRRDQFRERRSKCGAESYEDRPALFPHSLLRCQC